MITHAFSRRSRVLPYLGCVSLAGTWIVAAQQPPAPVPAEDAWPREIASGKVRITAYQPQIDEWNAYRTLHARLAVSITPPGEPPQLGTAFPDIPANVPAWTVAASSSIRAPGRARTAAACGIPIWHNGIRPTRRKCIAGSTGSPTPAMPASTVSANSKLTGRAEEPSSAAAVDSATAAVSTAVAAGPAASAGDDHPDLRQPI